MGLTSQKQHEDGHCVYVRKRYISMEGKRKHKKVYECLNSWGFIQSTVYIEINSPAILKIWEINMEERLLQYQPGKYHGIVQTINERNCPNCPIAIQTRPCNGNCLGGKTCCLKFQS